MKTIASFKKYSKAENFLFSQLAMYHKDGPKAIKKGLDNILLLTQVLDNPQDGYPIIHIAGTNGKGSVAHMIASILQASGLLVGMYTSPHYKDFRERIKINGKYIKKKEVTSFVNEIYVDIISIRPTFFEITVAMALDHFNKKQVDFAIIETGLGGRLDSTNIVKPVLSIITNISFDHQSTLGYSLEEIATEKVGIIKINTPVIIGERNEETSEVLISYADRQKSDIYWSDELIDIKKSALAKNRYSILNIRAGINWIDQLIIKNNSIISLINWRTALSAILLLKSTWPAIDQYIQKGINSLTKSTGYMGRWQTIHKKPLVIVDAAHNEAGIISLVSSLADVKHKDLFIVLGMVKGKDHIHLLEYFPNTARYYFCRANLPRSLEAKKLKKIAIKARLHGKTYGSVKKALKAAMKHADPKGDLIVVTGSSFVVGEVL